VSPDEGNINNFWNC